jgi:hypothetical protein
MSDRGLGLLAAGLFAAALLAAGWQLVSARPDVLHRLQEVIRHV